MEQDLISKKELLELTGISYGQLYRWKRKNLIPEDWFIRKSTFTGQETFFPKEKILARIDKIINMKDDLSLDELADVFSPNLAETAVFKEELIKRNIVSNTSLDLYTEQAGDAKVFPFEKILYVSILDQLLQTGDISLEEGKMLLRVLEDHYPKFQGKNCELVFIRKMGVSTFFLLSTPAEIYFEPGVKVVTRLNLASSIEELKIKIS
ncbi:YhbD family protein [Brevibacillus massiliensis]|jgi:predicted DNA-binding transcriptional regulator AlpA|uniref:YhbD family protein n=1 Tax=Brevibacillus massiliensis TaxID=1118054 RepID=UPI0002FDE09B|nr:YhbD family protein [Brevibacillus massiliensis]